MTKKRFIMIGDDGAIPEIIWKFKDKLPNINRLIANGLFYRVIPSARVDTPTNWTTIATGAWERAHGINGFEIHIPGEPFEDFQTVFNNTKLCKAEFIWEALDRQGKKSILINYPTAWPANIKNGIVIGGDNAFASPNWNMLGAAFYTNQKMNKTGEVCIEFSTAKDWKNLPHSHRQPLESVIPFSSNIKITWTKDGWKKEDVATSGGKEIIYHVVILDAEGNGYDTALVYKSKDVSDQVAALTAGQWSEWITEELPDKHGNIRKGTLKFKLLELSKDGKIFKLFRTSADTIDGWSRPGHFSKELIDNVGPYHQGLELNAVYGFAQGWFNEETYLELAEMQTDWICGAAKYLSSRIDWDMLFVQVHIQDAINHMFLGYLDKESSLFNEKKADKLWQIILKSHQITDKMVGRIQKDCIDKNTFVSFISDHGCIPIYYRTFVEIDLIKKGLISIKEKEGKKDVDLEKSKVVLLANDLWVNLKGREKHGSVQPGREYESVCREAINTLMSIRHPVTGECPILLAVRKEDAYLFGLGSERVGDVVFFMKSGYWNARLYELGGTWENALKMAEQKDFHSSFDPRRTGTHEFLPGTSLGGFSNCGTFIISGPAVPHKKSVLKTELVNIAPTITSLLNIDQPANAEGKKLTEI